MPPLPAETGPSAASSAAVLDRIFEGADFGMAICDLDGRFVRVNPALARMHGRATGDHLGRTVGELLPATGAPVVRVLTGILERGGSARRVRVAGSRETGRHFEYALHPLHDGDELIGAWAAVTETTEQDHEREEGRRLADELEDEHRITTQLQMSLLPDVIPMIPGADIASAFHPAGDGHEIGGDFMDVFRVGRPQCWMVVIGDVCGKGAEAAALTALARYTLRAAAIREGAEPGKLLAELNEAILRQHRDMRYLTAVCAFVQSTDAGLRMTVCVAGHPLPLKVAVDGTVTAVGRGGGLLGVFDAPQLYEEAVELAAGERLVLYTDGVTEAGAPEVELSQAGLTAALEGIATEQSARETIAAVERAIDAKGLVAGRDDVAMLVLRADPTG